MPRPSPLREKSYAFALHIVAYCRELYQMREFVLGKQLLKSGTSIGANVEEAMCAQSKADFIAKLSISFKESAETDFWLRLLMDSNTKAKEAAFLRGELVSIRRILTSSLNTLKGK